MEKLSVSLEDYIEEIKNRIDVANDIESQIKSKLNESKDDKFDPEFDKIDKVFKISFPFILI